MKSYKDMINEVLAKSTPIEEAKELDKACWKGYKAIGLKNKNGKKVPNCVPESYAGSQNSTATTDMSENHLVHVNDGSKYDEQPHEKDVEHVMAGVKLHGGENAGVSDKGVFFKFKSPEHASSFISHVNKCPNKSCDAHISEAITYGNAYPGLGTDVVDKKKKLNPQPNLTMKPKQVKDFTDKTYKGYSEELEEAKVYDPFTEEIELDESSLHRQHFQLVADLIRSHESAEKRKELAHHHAELFKKANPSFDHAKFMKAAGVNESIEEAKVYDPFTKKMVATKPIKVQAGGGATRNGVPVETGPSKYKSKLPMSKAAGVLAAEEVELIDELDKKTIGSYAKKATKDLKWQQTMRPFDAKRISNREKGIDKAIDRLAKEEVDLWQVKNTKTGNVYHSSSKYPISKNSPALKQIKAAGGDHVHAALYKNGKLVEESEQIDELSKRTLARYAKRATSSMKMKQMAATHLRDKHRDASDKHQSGVFNRETGIKRAIDKLAGKYYHEDVEHIDEISRKTMTSYISKAEDDVLQKQKAIKNSPTNSPQLKYSRAMDLYKRYGNINKAYKKVIAKEEVEQIDELSKDTLASYANKAVGDVSKDRSKNIKLADKKLYGNPNLNYKEEVEQIDELSKDTLASYAKKASQDARIKQHVAADFKSKEAHARNLRKKETWGSIAKKYQSKAWKREDGHDKAVDKLANKKTYEEFVGQIDEVSKSTLMRYIPSASRDVADNVYSAKDQVNRSTEHTRAGDWDASKTAHTKATTLFNKANKRIKGIDTATKKLGTQKEEVELDEGNGLSHALVQVGKSKWHIYDTKTKETHSTYNNKNVAMKKYGELNDKHAGYDSLGGLVHSKYGVRKEEVELEEAIAKKLPVQHAVDAVHATLGPRSATRFLSHLTPGSDKHTTWDKVNDALVKQGVQTHHIASIAQKTSHMNEEAIDESRGHKVLATFFKNREVAQRAYQGNPAHDAHVAQGGGTPADQGIAAAKKDAADLKKKLSEDQYTSEYKIKYFVDPITGENKTRKIRPHRVNFKSSRMNAAPAQETEPVKVNEGHDDYSSIAKELIKKHGKNVTAQHVKDFAGERDTHRGLDHAEVMHHIKKLSEDDKVYDEKWKKFTKGAK